MFNTNVSGFLGFCLLFINCSKEIPSALKSFIVCNHPFLKTLKSLKINSTGTFRITRRRRFSCSVVSNFCNSMDCSLPGFSVYGILQARILKWVAISFSRGSSQARNQTLVSCIAGRFFTNWATREARPGVKSSLLSVSKVRVVSTSLNGWGKKKKGSIFRGTWQLYTIQSSVSIK